MGTGVANQISAIMTCAIGAPRASTVGMCRCWAWRMRRLIMGESFSVSTARKYSELTKWTEGIGDAVVAALNSMHVGPV